MAQRAGVHALHMRTQSSIPSTTKSSECHLSNLKKKKSQPVLEYKLPMLTGRRGAGLFKQKINIMWAAMGTVYPEISKCWTRTQRRTFQQVLHFEQGQYRVLGHPGHLFIYVRDFSVGLVLNTVATKVSLFLEVLSPELPGVFVPQLTTSLTFPLLLDNNC